MAGAVTLAACGGGGDALEQGPAVTVTAPTDRSASVTGMADAQGVGGVAGADGSPGGSSATQAPAKLLTQAGAVRLAHQATFGPNEALVAALKQRTAAQWVQAQLALPASRLSSGGTAQIDKTANFCGTPPANKDPYCFRNNFSNEPLLWDFYRNAVNGQDQLRQRTALAWQQLMAVNDRVVWGTYGHRLYQNKLTELSFGNFRDLLRAVAVSPVMGEFLNQVDNDQTAPNENFARELLQIFSLGTCLLNPDGTLVGGTCKPTYSNDTIRDYAFALTGWTYPAGGMSQWMCNDGSGRNCRHLDGDMVGVDKLHNSAARSLLSGVKLSAGHSPTVALNAVLDSIMKHQNVAPYIATFLIKQLVMSNPPAAYVQRVANAFSTGQFKTNDGSKDYTFGTARPGDLTATVAAVLLDAVAREDAPTAVASGKLRSPALHFAGAIRAFNGQTDGGAFAYEWGAVMDQVIFSPASVFSFYPPDYTVAGTGGREGGEFGLHNVNSGLSRLNYLNSLFYFDGLRVDPSIPNATGTSVKLDGFYADASEPAKLVDRISRFAIGGLLPEPARSKVIAAVEQAAMVGSANWQKNRVAAAAYMVLGSSEYQVQR